MSLRRSPRKAAMTAATTATTASSAATSSAAATAWKAVMSTKAAVAAPRKARAAAASARKETDEASMQNEDGKDDAPDKKDAAKAAPAKRAQAKASATSTASHKRKSKAETDEDAEAAEPAAAVKKSKTTATTARTAKAKKAGDAPLAERTDVTTLAKQMYIGAHVSSAGSVANAVDNSLHVGGNAFALFLQSQRKWQNPPLTAAVCADFRARCAAAGIDAGRHCLPHGSYLVNLAQADDAKAAQAYAHFVDDLRRCAALGIGLYNLHPGAVGSGAGASAAAAHARIAAALNRAHRDTAPESGTSAGVVVLLENMAGAGTSVGGRFEELAAIIAQVDDKTRVGVCLDTCHAFAAGYDLRTPEQLHAVLAEFDRVVGLRYLRAVHLNDSKAPLGSRRDLHANIGTGCLGLRAFHSIVNHDAFVGLPIVLETPLDECAPASGSAKPVEDLQVWADEIKLLERLIGMDPASPAFCRLEADLHAQGAAERARIQGQVDKKKK